MKRPWCTVGLPFSCALTLFMTQANMTTQMFFGIIILILVATFGVFNSSNLPIGMTKDVWVYRNDPGSADVSVCRGSLHAAGLRGSILGWTDGFLQNWDTAYFGG